MCFEFEGSKRRNQYCSVMQSDSRICIHAQNDVSFINSFLQFELSSSVSSSFLTEKTLEIRFHDIIEKARCSSGHRSHYTSDANTKAAPVTGGPRRGGYTTKRAIFKKFICCALMKCQIEIQKCTTNEWRIWDTAFLLLDKQEYHSVLKWHVRRTRKAGQAQTHRQTQTRQTDTSGTDWRKHDRQTHPEQTDADRSQTSWQR
jgi:hypothetical protein